MEGPENRKNVPKHARKIKERGKGVEVCIDKTVDEVQCLIGGGGGGRQ